MKQNNDNFNESFWAYVYLMIKDDSFITQKGKIIKFIVQEGGCCKSITMLSRKLKIEKCMMGKILCNLQEEGYITLVQQGKYKMVKFNEDIITNALKIPYNVLGDTDNGY